MPKAYSTFWRGQEVVATFDSLCSGHHSIQSLTQLDDPRFTWLQWVLLKGGRAGGGGCTA